jgi:hypothetical protein
VQSVLMKIETVTLILLVIVVIIEGILWRRGA